MRMREASEEELMQAYAEGDARAFERLLARVGPPLRAFFRRSAGNAAEAEDLLQATLLKVHAARGRWRPGEPLRPWLFTVAARVRLDALRRAGRAAEELRPRSNAEGEAPAEAAPSAGSSPGALDAMLAGERGARVRAAIEALPEAQRAVVHLHRFEELSFAQIGAALGITEGAAKLRAFRAYERLRVELGDLVEGER